MESESRTLIDLVGDVGRSVRSSVITRIAFLGLLLLLLRIPIYQIVSLTHEREEARSSAVYEVAHGWGGPQFLGGPLLSVPYRRFVEEEGRPKRTVTDVAHFLPERLSVSAEVSTERRRRGIFEVPLYVASVRLEGSFVLPDFSGFEVAPEDVLWDSASVALGVEDVRAIKDRVELTFGSETRSFEPALPPSSPFRAGIQAPVRLDPATKEYPFSLELRLNGSDALRFQPSGEETVVSVSSDWSDPSFVGAYLPASREIRADGFTAEWSVPYLGRNYPQRWRGGTVGVDAVDQSAFGVSFLVPVDAYRMTRRAVKYEFLFTLLTLALVFCFEVSGGLRLHAVQYVLVGFALCLFYLLTLSLAEHVGFELAYALAALGVVGLVSVYGRSVLERLSRAVWMGSLMAALYAFLYVLLALQDYSLLAGSVGLFAILALAMLLTRNVRWHELRLSGGRASVTAPAGPGPGPEELR